MQLLKAVKAYKAITDLGEEKLNFKTAHSLLVAKKELEPHIEFFTQEEMKLVNEYAVKGEDGKVSFENGNFQLTAENAEKYVEKHRELDEVEIDIKKKRLPPIDNVSISALEALSEIFDFEEGEE